MNFSQELMREKRQAKEGVCEKNCFGNVYHLLQCKCVIKGVYF